jgi:hypothetical protein
MYGYYPYDWHGRAPQPISYVRVLHASPDAPAVDIYANGKLIVRGLAYKAFTPYVKVNSGEYKVDVFPAGQVTSPVLSTNVTIPAQSITTVAAIGYLPELSLYPVPDPVMEKTPGLTNVRFVHLSPNTPNVDITLPDGRRLFTNIGYKGITEYLPVNPGTYTFELRPTGTETIALYVPNIRLLPDRFYTIYAVGLTGANPPLQVLIPLDGNSYIKF